LASRLGRLSRGRNVQAHPDLGLARDIVELDPAAAPPPCAEACGPPVQEASEQAPPRWLARWPSEPGGEPRGAPLPVEDMKEKEEEESAAPVAPQKLAAKERRKPHVQEPRVQQPQCGSPEAGVAEVTLLDGQSRNEKECEKTKEEEKCAPAAAEAPPGAVVNELGVQAPLSSWDPAGLTTGGDAGSRRRRDTEVRHGRISMLATMGYVAPVCAGKHPDMWSSPAGLMRATRELLARALGMEACGAVVDYAGAVAGSGGLDVAELVGADCTRKSAKKQRKRNKKVSVENVHEVDVKGKKVLVLCDPHVPGATDPQTPDVTHFMASLFIIEYLCSKGAMVIVCSHLGRPEVGPGAGPSPDSTAKRLGELMGKDIKCALDCTAAEEVKAAVDAMAEGDVIFLETTCIVNEEEVGGPERAESWAGLADLFVHDAVGFARRAHWSAEGATMERGLVSPTRPHSGAGDSANTP